MWPSPEYIDRWKFDSNTFIKTINFKQNGAINGIQISLSNGIKSPLFQAQAGEDLPLQTVDSENLSERTKKLSVYMSGDEKYMFGMKLLDDTDKVLFNINKISN